MIIRIRCGYTEMVPVGALESIQGKLKREHEIPKLAESMRRNGFVFPVFCWKDGERYCIVDGVHRLKAARLLIAQGHELPAVPVILIPAKSLEEAKHLLLLATSRYSKTTKAGFIEFAHDLDWAELRQELSSIDYRYLFDTAKVKVEQLAGKVQRPPRLTAKKDIAHRVFQITFRSKAEKAQYIAAIEGLRALPHYGDEAEILVTAVQQMAQGAAA